MSVKSRFKRAGLRSHSDIGLSALVFAGSLALSQSASAKSADDLKRVLSDLELTPGVCTIFYDAFKSGGVLPKGMETFEAKDEGYGPDYFVRSDFMTGAGFEAAMKDGEAERIRTQLEAVSPLTTMSLADDAMKSVTREFAARCDKAMGFTPTAKLEERHPDRLVCLRNFAIVQVDSQRKQDARKAHHYNILYDRVGHHLIHSGLSRGAFSAGMKVIGNEKMSLMTKGHAGDLYWAMTSTDDQKAKTKAREIAAFQQELTVCQDHFTLIVQEMLNAEQAGQP